MPRARRRILLGVTGSIAAYKTPQLIRDLIRDGAEVRVAMTLSASAFVTPLTLATVSQNPVVIDPLPTDAGAPNAGTWHIELAHWADVMLIAPASANTIAKLVQGRADSAVAMLALAMPGQIMVAPAMDTDMLVNSATQHNLRTLRERGVVVIDPERGALASGLEGEGRLPSAEKILGEVNTFFVKRNSLKGVRIVVTAGPTHEAIDPVRFIGNSSSGKMGFAIAGDAALRGAEVTLIAGPTSLPIPGTMKRIDVTSADEMFVAVQREAKRANVLVMAAAVADYTPARVSKTKLKKTTDQRSIALVPTVDILKSLAPSKGKRIHIGFALESDHGVANARTKLREKKLDMIILNPATGTERGIGGDRNSITIIDRKGTSKPLPRMSKRACAEAILDRIAALLPKPGKRP